LVENTGGSSYVNQSDARIQIIRNALETVGGDTFYNLSLATLDGTYTDHMDLFFFYDGFAIKSNTDPDAVEIQSYKFKDKYVS
jgi:hypothetical protein